MPQKSFFNSIKDSLHQIVSGTDKDEPAADATHHKQSAENEIETAVIVLATEVMRLGGNQSTETEKILADFLAKNFGKTNPAKRKKTIQDHLFVGPQAFTRMACEEVKSLTTHESKFEIIRLLFEIASLDDFINAKETAVIQKIARYLSISGEELKTLREKYGRINDPFVILEMENTVSIIEVKTAYRRMALKYHPDKRAKGISEEEANRKFREVKRAYELILKKLKG